MKTFLSYATTLDCTQMLNMWEMDAHAFQEKSKKMKIKGTFNGQSSGVTNKWSKP